MSDSKELIDTRTDPYARAAKSASVNGLFLSFNRVGNFVAGQDKIKIPLGTRLIANMPGLRDGWRRWFGGRCEQDETFLVATGEEAKPRSEMGDLDKALWERDPPTPQNPNPSPRDPWQLTYMLDLADDEGQIYIFSASATTYRNSVSRFCGKYADEYRMRPGMLPIITLGRSSYESRKFGEQYVPEFEIVGWTDANRPSTKGDMQEALPVAQGQRAANPMRVEAGEPSQTHQTSPTSTPTSPSSGATRPTRF